MKQVYIVLKVTLADGEVETLETLEPLEQGFYTRKNAISHAIRQHEATGLRYAIMQLVGITGSVVRPVSSKDEE